MSQNTETLLTVAADLRVVGYSWAQIADEVHRRPDTVQKWPARYKRDWDRIYKEAQRRRFEETNGECHLVLKQLLRSASENSRLKAVGLWLKSGGTACGQTGQTGQTQADAPPENDFTRLAAYLSEEVPAARDRIARDRARQGLPALSEADAIEAYLNELLGEDDPGARPPDPPPTPTPPTSPTPMMPGGGAAWALGLLAVVLAARPAADPAPLAETQRGARSWSALACRGPGPYPDGFLSPGPRTPRAGSFPDGRPVPDHQGLQALRRPGPP
ncbi:MAG TPA: hypothetical protein VM597_05905 [Gemmataceae bacterium]|nr:hypothetical protein [Gemmataceae bacterium]